MDTDTITIIFPKVRVKIPIKDLTFDSIENMVFEITQSIARKVIEKAITDIDNKLRDKRERGKLKNTGKRKKYFFTRFGDILYSRTPYKDKKGKAHYLVDEALGIKKNQRISLIRAKIKCFLASLSSYREVVDGISLLIGYPRSHESIRQSVIREAELIIKDQEERLERVRNLDCQEGNPPEIAYLEADATSIKLQDNRIKHQPDNCFSLQKEGDEME